MTDSEKKELVKLSYNARRGELNLPTTLIPEMEEDLQLIVDDGKSSNKSGFYKDIRDMAKSAARSQKKRIKKGANLRKWVVKM